MKRFHAHVAVDDLASSIAFYSRLFGQAPSKERADYAKWMLEDPRVNFAISARGHASGLNHFGMQVDSPEELESLKLLADMASGDKTLEQGSASCCYSKSDKHWTVDPQGIAWEHFHTMEDVLAFGEDTGSSNEACCIPLRNQDADESSPCCIPKEGAQAQAGACCG
jgi:hypothetical protein